jgi:hypothetical protein
MDKAWTTRRWSAERASSTLRSTTLKAQWDQLLICTVSKVKSVFSRKHQVEQSENDKNRRTFEEESEEARQDRARLLLEENEECEGIKMPIPLLSSSEQR